MFADDEITEPRKDGTPCQEGLADEVSTGSDRVLIWQELRFGLELPGRYRSRY